MWMASASVRALGRTSEPHHSFQLLQGLPGAGTQLEPAHVGSPSPLSFPGSGSTTFMNQPDTYPPLGTTPHLLCPHPWLSSAGLRELQGD